MRLREAATGDAADLAGFPEFPELASAIERLFSLNERLDDEPMRDDDDAPSSDPDPALKNKPYVLKQSQG